MVFSSRFLKKPRKKIFKFAKLGKKHNKIIKKTFKRKI